MSVLGIDVSSNNQNLNILSLGSDWKVSYVKATEGKSYINPCMKTQFDNSRSKGMGVGFYHFANGNSTPEVQAEFFKKVISNYAYNLKPCLDIEAGFDGDASDFIERFCKVLGGRDKVIIYTGYSFYHERIWVHDYDMWIAAYNGRTSKPSIKDNKLIGWQYGDNGINGRTDVSEWYTIPYLSAATHVSNTVSKVVSNIVKPITMGKVSGANCVIVNDYFYTRDASGNQIGGRVDIGDKCRIDDVSYSKQLCSIEYPVKGGTKKAYIKNVPSMIRYTGRIWRNGSTSEPVYDNDQKSNIGKLNPHESAIVLADKSGWHNVVYDTDKGAKTKSGWVRYSGN